MTFFEKMTLHDKFDHGSLYGLFFALRTSLILIGLDIIGYWTGHKYFLKGNVFSQRMNDCKYLHE